MKNKALQDFFLGFMIAFTFSVIILSVVMLTICNSTTVPVTFISQVFVVSILCSLINLVYRAEKLKFIWQSILGYVLNTATLMICGSIFGWYDYGRNAINRTGFIFGTFILYSLFYLVTWIIIWRITEARKKVLNDKLTEYKQRA